MRSEWSGQPYLSILNFWILNFVPFSWNFPQRRSQKCNFFWNDTQLTEVSSSRDTANSNDITSMKLFVNILELCFNLRVVEKTRFFLLVPDLLFPDYTSPNSTSLGASIPRNEYHKRIIWIQHFVY